MLTARATLAVACAVAFLAACASPDEDAQAVALAFQADPQSADFGSVDVRLGAASVGALKRANPTDSVLREVLAVYTGAQPPSASQPAVLGSYELTDQAIRFRPRFPPMPGQSYRVRFDPDGLPSSARTRYTGAAIDSVVVIPRAVDGAPTMVTQVYPSGDTLPVNLLRLYIHFSAPMSTGAAYERVLLLDQNGKRIEDAFLVVAGERELWNPERTRLTLFFDPGRIKRDLRPHEEAGLPLHEGQSFSIAIDSAWRDARGNPLGAPHEKRFYVGPADRTVPRTRDWTITAPPAATDSPLVVRFAEPLDHALLLRLLVVKDENGSPVRGAAAVDALETRWRFTPAVPWPAGRYSLDVAAELEDLAGNNLRHVFDRERGQARDVLRDSMVSLPFTVSR